MSLVKWAFIGLIALPAAELLALVMVASLIGWLRAAALFIGTSVVGVLLLRKSGRADLDALPRGLRSAKACVRCTWKRPAWPPYLVESF